MRRAALVVLASVGLALGSVVACSSFGEDPGDAADGGVEGGPAADVLVDPPGSDGDVLPTDCKAIHAADATKPDGVYTIGPSGAPGGVEVYCDMTTDDGGWTLVGRSVLGAAATAPFGWSTSSNGSPDDNFAPYSANAVALRLAFREILLGSRGDMRTWVPPIYHTGADEGFLGTCAEAGCPTDVLPVTDSGCAHPRQLGYDGFTSRTDGFFFRDQITDDKTVYGLGPSGWETNYQNLCMEDANLDGKQGMIFVR